LNQSDRLRQKFCGLRLALPRGSLCDYRASWLQAHRITRLRPPNRECLAIPRYAHRHFVNRGGKLGPVVQLVTEPTARCAHGSFPNNPLRAADLGLDFRIGGIVGDEAG
jgi:hypothetical protein